ncbi:RNA polymerase sigma factor [Robertkochia solimangrovi]|uniref:RNA polymerase sigma factor n=1 Tax=Robertkochia solimangrovi TaxID=2213046 RepID=UPI00117CAEA8|nr:RNA polymerase sigma factor [Robertkochia solimangrovi]TRZ42809.1 RNA polymerase subunit sigma-70 [Robertkochia solimangrovi]
MMQTDLIEKCKNNDHLAQMRLYDQYCDAMYCVSLRFLKDPDDAKDTTQEAFIKAFQRLGQFRAEVTFGAWLKRIVINQCIDFLKSRHQHHLSLEENYLQVADAAEENWEVDDDISVEAVKEAIAGLPEKYRYVVMLYLIEGYDHQEIAQILGITTITSRTQLMRGKQKLQELLKHKRNGTRH